jgi:rsbT co-antagonist protein RsbR
VVGETHARIGLPPQVYLAATNVSWNIFGEALAKSDLPKRELPAAINSMTRLMHFDSGIVIEEFSNVTSDLISQQSKALMEMSTPVTTIWGGILMLPIVGIIDSKRSMDIMNAMLSKISEARAQVIILDISGIAVVDTAVANHLMKITRATKLMGCECLISGVSAAIAQTIVELGIDVGTISTTTTLHDALENAFRLTGVALRQAT